MTDYMPLSVSGFFVGRILMALTAKFFITVSFNAIYVFSAELFPTVVRYRDIYDLLFKPEKDAIDRNDGKCHALVFRVDDWSSVHRGCRTGALHSTF